MKLYVHARSNFGDGDEDYGYDISSRTASRNLVNENGNSHTFIVNKYCRPCKGTGVIPPRADGDKDRYLSEICQNCEGDTVLEIERLSASEFTRKYSEWFEISDSGWSGAT